MFTGFFYNTAGRRNYMKNQAQGIYPSAVFEFRRYRNLAKKF
jgi:hypothetical protein